ncbi:Glyoxylase, beta-lactamase superfamily II [Cohaesibacter marisflavi]|uniref:beta-lactamase n=1 Tax=Cohaesibacter marisflavi TaxID=655353 RepID=A0A1I5F2A6_9HYPH|nr:subclass B1 metallo-beta-lactamase, long type [Cohaesibacter marisflavi]SFO17884.1 Glyoxylase, beta-lactamase superfamily II [Cohaesibacter marisflavi]
MRKFGMFLATLLAALSLLLPSAQSSEGFAISESITITPITQNAFVHSSDNNNGLIYISGDEALIVSTPQTDRQTQDLIDWVTQEKHLKIVGYVIDRWHPDAMGGLAAVHANDIPSYAYLRTQQIARQKGLPVPHHAMDERTIIHVGDQTVECAFLGKAHTEDGIVVWLPKEQVLFGGNEIRNYNGWVGNIADANLKDWASTARRIKDLYGTARIVIPGHGPFGGAELIDYTIDLFTPFSQQIKNALHPDLSYLLDQRPVIVVKASESSKEGDTKIFKEATILSSDATKYVRIDAPIVRWNIKNNRIDSAEGHLAIFDKTAGGAELRASAAYTKLIVIPVNEQVGLAVIVKAMTPD